MPSQDCFGSPIVWDANNGTNPEGLPTTVNADGTINLSLLPRPTRQYYLFAGWSNGTTTFTGDETAANINPTGAPSITMTTLWTPEPFAISYTMNGGSATNATSYTIESGAITLTNPTRSYYTFKGWSGTGLTGDTNTTVTIPAGSTGARSYTANWTPVNYTITYTLNGGSVSNPTTYNIETATFTLNNPTRSGLSFSGWSGTGLSGSANKTVTITQGSVGNRSYTANWAPTTTVWNYGYTGGMQSFSVPATGTYKLEVWGAQGGSVSGAAGGKGGYAVGNKALTAGQVLYIGVGGQNTDFNGGSSYSGRSAAQDNFDNAAKGGGGGSHFGLTNTQISATSKTNLLVVAGGGGGGIWTIFYVGPTTYYGAGGAGGGTSGSAGAANGYSGGYSYVGGGGGTQSAGGSQAAWTSNSDCLPARYAGYGVGGVAHKTCWQGVGGGGGGGYYGGGAGYNGGGGGGSSYTGGVTSGSTTANQRTGNGYARVTWVGN